MIGGVQQQRRKHRRKDRRKAMHFEQDKVVDSEIDIEFNKRLRESEKNNPSAAGRRDPKPRLTHST
jgi:hypothetical protein